MDKILLALKIQSNCLHSLGQLIYWHASISSGHYKTRKLYHGTRGPEFTDEEKLENAIDTMSSHCRNISDCSENIKGIGNE